MNNTYVYTTIFYLALVMFSGFQFSWIWLGLAIVCDWGVNAQVRQDFDEFNRNRQA